MNLFTFLFKMTLFSSIFLYFLQKVMLRIFSYHLIKRNIIINRKPHFSNHRGFWYKFFIMPKVNCSVIGCSNSTYNINNWQKEAFSEHNLEVEGTCNKIGNCLEWKPQFHLHTFSDPIKCKQLRGAWIRAVRQEPFDKKGY